MQYQHLFTQDQTPEGTSSCISCGVPLALEGFRPLDPIECPECQTEQVVPVTIGQYRLVRFLGEGAMGRVYEGQDLHLSRPVAVKLLKEDLASTPKMWTLLEREARAAGNISHNNVVQVYSFGKLKGRPYIVMEMVNAGSLEDQLRAKGPLPESTVIPIAIDVMKGLQAANRVELLHGDIKPANIILTADGTAKVVDFGLARFQEDHTVVERWGTPYYIAPEKSQQLQEDFRSDMYSLGATLFHVVSGYPPFTGPSEEEVVEKSLHRSTPKLAQRYPDCSTAFSEVIYTMMQRDPDKRFWSYDKAIACMQEVQAGTYILGQAQPTAQESTFRKRFWQRLTKGMPTGNRKN